MNSPNYCFLTHWQVEATCEEVYNTLKNTNELPRWWRAVYLDVAIRENGDSNGLGKVVELYTKGWLPHTIKWQFSVTATDPVHHSGYALQAFGDLVGRGIWSFEQRGTMCHITYDWQLSVEKPLLKYFSFMLKPFFSANHHWAMNKGFESLKLELRRQRGAQNVPPPPPPTFPHNLLNNNVLNRVSIAEIQNSAA